jgi:tripartite-type tricarboxylate transporter receptor subunit TctC
MAGQVDFMFDTTVVAGAHIQSGKLRALAVTSSRRLTDTITDVPTVAESGWPGTQGFEVVSWQALFAPAGTPKPIVDRLHAEILKIIQSAEMQDRIKGLGMQPSVMTPEQVQSFQKAEIDKWAQVIKAANIKLE